MSDKFVTLATFGTATEAHVVKNALEAAGIQGYLLGEELTNMNWGLGTALGGVQLQVAEPDLERAAAVLERQPARPKPAGPPDASFAETRTCPECGQSFSADCDYCPACGPPDDFSEPEDEIDTAVTTAEVVASVTADELAGRAFRAAVIGLFFFPLHLYALWLLARLTFSSTELSPQAMKRFLGALAIEGLMFVIVVMYGRFLWYFFVHMISPGIY